MASRLADQLRLVRTEAKLSQEDIAEALGVTRGQVGHVETGRSATSLEAIDKWAARCGAAVDVRRLTGNDVTITTTGAVAAAVREVELLPPTEQDLVRRLARAMPHMHKSLHGSTLNYLRSLVEQVEREQATTSANGTCPA